VVRFPVIVTLPVTVPPVFAFNELLARAKAAFAYVPEFIAFVFAVFA
jgi:hypothetical protein